MANQKIQNCNAKRQVPEDHLYSEFKDLGTKQIQGPPPSRKSDGT